MGSALAACVPLALAVLASPLAIIAVILILLTPRARANGSAFALGWVIGLVGIGLVGILVLDQTSVHTGGGTSVMRWAKGLVGVVLIGLAVRSWLGRPRDGAPGKSPAWMSALSSFTPVKSLGLGVTLSGVKPKNLLLTLAAAAVISEAGLERGAEFSVLAAFVVIASLGILTPLGAYLALGERAPVVLEGWSRWLTRNSAIVVGVVMLVMGLVLVAMAVAG